MSRSIARIVKAYHSFRLLLCMEGYKEPLEPLIFVSIIYSERGEKTAISIRGKCRAIRS